MRVGCGTERATAPRSRCRWAPWNWRRPAGQATRRPTRGRRYVAPQLDKQEIHRPVAQDLIRDVDAVGRLGVLGLAWLGRCHTVWRVSWIRASPGRANAGDQVGGVETFASPSPI